MSRRINNNFRKRFGDRISMTYREKPLTVSEKKLQNDSLSKAITHVLAGILKREPASEELLGITEIKGVKTRY